MSMGFWNKFTTRFAVPLLIFSQIVTLYDGWESRIESRDYEQTLKLCIAGHSHHEEYRETIVSVDGEQIEWVIESVAIFPDGCDSISFINSLKDSFTPERTMDRWLGKVFWTYKNTKDRVVTWYEELFIQKQLEDIRG